MFAKRLITRFIFTVLIVASLFFSSLGTTPVYAAGITVNTKADKITNDGRCTLREAITTANSNSALYSNPIAGECATGFGIDTITFAGNYTITLAGGQLPPVTSQIIINGNGAVNTIIQANANPDTATYRVFQVSGPGNLTLDSLTVRHGYCFGGCFGGGISKSGGTLTITNSTISENRAGNSGGGIYNGSGNLTITNSIISGNNVSNSGGGIYSVGALTISGSTFSGNDASENGGALYYQNSALITVASSTFSDNSASYGGGIYNDDGDMTVIESTFSGNSASDSGGGIRNAQGDINIVDSTLSGNSASNGGGIYNGDGSGLTITRSIITENTASSHGGGISNNGILNATNSTISGNNASNGGGISTSINSSSIANSIISGNSASNEGGGIYNNHGGASVTNSTLSGNDATNGGGIYNNGDLGVRDSTLFGNVAAMGGGIYNSDILNVANSTLSGNEAYDYGGGIYSDGSAWIYNSTIAFNTLIEGTNLGAGGIDGDVALYNTIVAGNIRLLTSQYQDCSGTMYIEGMNLFWDLTNCSFNPASPGYYGTLYSLSELGPLQDNGGPTWTHALIPIEEGSRAIDAGDDDICAFFVYNLDQRGVTRPQGSHCDVGAYEAVPTFLSTAEQDGWILEASETSGKGGSKNNTASTIQLGDNAANKQYRSILSFDTSAIPDGATINKVTLKVKKAAVKGGGNPVKLLKGFMIDVKTGEFGAAALELGDFKAAGDLTLGPLKPPLVNGWYSLDLTAANQQINTTGNTQIRLRFKLDDNNNLVANTLTLYSGNAAITNQPLLVVEYAAP